MQPKRNFLVLIGVTVLSLALPGRAEPPAIAQKEIDHLLSYMEESQCEFYRNGRWYDSKQAQAHLRNKYEYLVSHNLINSAEDFIERAATKSSWSGQPYQIQCSSGAAVWSRPWLSEELARYRNKRIGVADPAGDIKPLPVP